jgi:hypothetical protein
MAYSETLRMEAALCIWEEMLDVDRHAKSAVSVTNIKAPPFHITLSLTWDRRGTVEMRHTAIALADKALEVFDLIGGADGAEALDLIPYDWEFIPAFVARVDWTDCTADPAAIAASLKSRSPDGGPNDDA